MKQLNTQFELYPYIFSLKAQNYPRIKQAQEHGYGAEIVVNLMDLHNKVVVPILIHFKDCQLFLNSGYRCLELNRLVGSKSDKSDHVFGKAVDLELRRNGKDINKELFDFCKTLKFKQLIDENNLSWVHISYDKYNLKQQILTI